MKAGWILVVSAVSLGGGCNRSEKKDDKKGAEVVAEGKPEKAVQAALTVSPGATPQLMHLTLDVTATRDGESLDVQFQLPDGVKARDGQALQARESPVASGLKKQYALDVELTDQVAQQGADVLVVTVLHLRGVNKDTVTSVGRVGPPAGSAAAPATNTVDGTGQPIREVQKK